MYIPASNGLGRLSPETDQNLCFERQAEDDWRLRTCDFNDDMQLVAGWKPSGRFELFPAGQSLRCFSQQHHPKDFEEVYPERCSVARGDKTSYWEVFNPSGSYSPGPGPTSPPPSPTQSSCVLSLGLFDDQIIEDGQSFQSPNDNNLYLQQWRNGNLVVWDTSNKRSLWDSGESENDGDYWTQLQVRN